MLKIRQYFFQKNTDQEKAKFKVQPSKVGKKAEIEIVPKISGKIDGCMCKDFGVVENTLYLSVKVSISFTVTSMTRNATLLPYLT